jgi:hypothetical protein
MPSEIMTWVMYGLLLFLPVALALAGWRNRGMHIGYTLGEVAAWPFNGIGTFAKVNGAPLRREAARGAGDVVEDGAAISSFTAPLLFAAAMVLFAVTEVALAVLGWAALHHEIPPVWMARRTAVLAAIAGVTSALFWGLMAVDANSGKIAGPWREMPMASRRRFQIMAWTFAIGSLVTLAVFYGWRELQIQYAATGDLGGLRRWMGVTIIIVFGAIIGGAVLFSGWSLLKSLDIVGVVTVGLPGWLLGCIEHGCRSAIENGLDGCFGLTTAVYDHPASAGRAFWNWGCSFEAVGDRLHFAPIVFEERPRIVPKF